MHLLMSHHVVKKLVTGTTHIMETYSVCETKIKVKLTETVDNHVMDTHKEFCKQKMGLCIENFRI